MLQFLLASLLGATLPADTSARTIVIAPAESLRVTTAGPVDGPTVVIIPGLISPAYAFRKVLPSLEQAGVHAVVIEPLGVGHSSRPGAADYSHTAQAARIAAVLDSLHVGRAVVVGHAVGASMALRLALARPEQVRGLLLIEGAAVETPAVAGVKKALKYAFFVKLFAGRGRVRKELRKALVASSGDTTWVTDQVIDAYTEGSAGDLGAVLRALKGMQRSVEPDSLTPQLGKIGVPILLLVGGAAHESGISSGRIRALERRVPNFRMQTVFDAGLHIHEERPEAVIQSLLQLVREVHP